MDLLQIKENTYKLAKCIDGLNDMEEKFPPFLIHRIAEIYQNGLKGIRDFFDPTTAVTFSQQVSCAIKQSWQLSPDKFSEITRILQQELWRATDDERDQVTTSIKNIFLRSHSTPFEIASQLLIVEPLSEIEILLANDIRFDFDVRLRIIKRLFSARHKMTLLHASAFVDFIADLDDSYRKRDRDEILSLAQQASSLPYDELPSLIISKLSNYLNLNPQGVGALELALNSFGGATIEVIISEELWHHNVALCRRIINANRYYRPGTIDKLIELYNHKIPDDLKTCILERLRFFYQMPSHNESDNTIHSFMIEQKKNEVTSNQRHILESFNVSIELEHLISTYLQNPGSNSLLKQIRHNADIVVPGLLEVVKRKKGSQQERDAALHALSRINHIRFKEIITDEILILLQDTNLNFDSTYYKMLACLKTDGPKVRELLDKLVSLDTSNPTLRSEVLSLWNRIYPDSPRPLQVD